MQKRNHKDLQEGKHAQPTNHKKMEASHQKM